jgi:Domain of unknown function (DUF4184)
MPFTLAHPAIAWPLWRLHRGSFLPLVAGSVGPDLQYFLPAKIADRLPNSHMLPGALVSGPIEAFALLTVIWILRHALVAPLWGRVYSIAWRSLCSFRGRAIDWFCAIPAICVGVALHLLWDAWTHSYGWPVRHFVLMRSDVSPISGVVMEAFRALQWISSVVGITILTFAFARGRSSIPVTSDLPQGTSLKVVALIVISIASAAAGAVRAAGGGPHYASVHGWLYLFSTSSCALFACGYLLWGAIVARKAAYSST